MQNFYNEQRCSDLTGEKERMILAAAKLLKTEIKEMKCCSQPYPNSDEIGSLEFCKQFVQRLCACFWKVSSTKRMTVLISINFYIMARFLLFTVTLLVKFFIT